MPINNVWDESFGHRQIKMICRKCFRKTEGGWTLTFGKTALNCSMRWSSLFSSILVCFVFFFCYVEIFFSVYLPQQTNAYFKKRRFPLELKRPQITWRSFFITPVGGKPFGYEQSMTSDSNLAPRKRLARVRPHRDSRAQTHFSSLCHCKKN